MKPEISVVVNQFASKGALEGANTSVIETCEKLIALSKALCPVKFGELRNTLMYRTKKTEGLFNNESGDRAPSSDKLDKVNEELTGYAGTNSDHWYPEFGTRNQVAQPFLRPAGEIVKGGELNNVIAKYNRDAMEKEFKKKKVKKRGL